MSLIEESDEFVILVTPYVKISKWYKLTKRIDKLKSRNIPFEFIIRKDISNLNAIEESKEKGYKYQEIPDLHAKLYLNEKHAIVSSMNLLLNSDTNSIDLGYITETTEEYSELVDFCKRYLSINFESNKTLPKSNIDKTKTAEPTITQVNTPEPVIVKTHFTSDWRVDTKEALVSRFKKKISISYTDSAVSFIVGNNVYDCYMWNTKNNNIFRVTCKLSQNSFRKVCQSITYLESQTKLKFEQYPGSFNNHDKIIVSLVENLESEQITSLTENEKPLISERLIEFITIIEKY